MDTVHGKSGRINVVPLLLVAVALGAVLQVFATEMRQVVDTEAKKAQPANRPRLVAHRGLIRHAPENTLAAFGACIDLGLGFELDVRRTKDGHLVCLHDDDVKRTTNGTGKVADMTWPDLQKLDAGGWFDPAFGGERVPMLDAVFALVKHRQARQVLIALDLKIDDAKVEADMVRLAEQHGVLDQVICIGRAISEPAVRRKLRAANAKVPVAVLANKPGELPAALADKDSNWIYIRFLPTAEQVAAIHKAGKRILLVGPLVAGKEPENWARTLEAGVDAMLTDYPLHCREIWRSSKTQ